MSGQMDKPTADIAAQTSRQIQTAQTKDLFLRAAQYIARVWARSTSADVLTAGLPLEDGQLTADLLVRAAERVGLGVQRRLVRVGKLDSFDLPALIVGETGKPLVVLAQNGADVVVYNPELDKEETLPLAGSLAEPRDALIFKPKQTEAGDDADASSQTGRHWLRDALSGHWRGLIFVMLAATFINIFAVVMPLFTLNVYDRVLPNKAVATLWVLATGVFLVFLFDFLLKAARAAIIDHAGRQIDLRLSSVLFDKVLNTALHARPGSTGAFVNRIAQYEVLRDFLTAHTVVMFIDILFMGIFVYVIAMLIGWVVLFPVLATAIAIATTLIIGARSRAAVKSALQESSTRNALLVEALSCVQTVKTSRAEGLFQSRWESAVLASSETQSRIKQYQSVAGQVTSVLGQLSSVCIIIGSTYLFAEGEISMGAIIASMMLSSRIIAPVAQISATLLRTRSAIEAYQTLSNIMELPDERRIGKGFVTREIAEGAISFTKVRFAYPDTEHFVLDQVSFSIGPGEKVGVIGRVGSGKTTLGRLLVNFYQPQEGDIMIDGVSIQQYHPAELRRQVGLVLQDPELFSGTVKENILLSNPQADDADLLEVSTRAGVSEFVSRHPSGFDLKVGERGVLLSGGQRQAVALARILLAKPRILFLDEPSSSMDLATERQLIQHLSNSLEPQHTVLIATHRFSLLSLVERIIMLDNGRIVADGPRDEVLERLRGSAGGGTGND